MADRGAGYTATVMADRGDGYTATVMADRGAVVRFILVMVVMVVVVAGILFLADRLKPHKEDRVARIIDHSGGVDSVPNKAKTGQFPWQVLLTIERFNDSKVSFCSGSIIYRDWILTAAHCLTTRDLDIKPPNGYLDMVNWFRIDAGISYLIKAYQTPLNENKYTREDIMYQGDHKCVFIHEEYNKGIALVNDIAIIKLKEVLVFSTYVQPISLASELDSFPNSLFTASGWGHTSYKPGADIVYDLRYVTGLELLEQNKCKAHYDTNYTLESMICFQGIKKRFFKSDSGGPITTEIIKYGFTSRFVQVGIVSWGNPINEYLGVATEVSKFREWIQGKTPILLLDTCPANQRALRSADTPDLADTLYKEICRYGECINGGRCTCYPGYMGPSCDVKQTVCPEDRGFFSPTGSKQCFKLFESKVTWEQAKQTCTEQGLFLAHPWDAVGLRSYIVQRYGGLESYWLGAKSMLWEDNRVEIKSDNPLWFTIDPERAQPRSQEGCLILLTQYDYWKEAANQPFWENSCSALRKPLCEFRCDDCQHGYCFYSACICHDGYTGIHCSEKETDLILNTCPTNQGDLGSTETLNKSNCRYGECINGRCACYPGYKGPSCDEKETVCPEDRGFFSPTGSKQCFKLFESKVTWEQAKQTCTDHGLFLAHPWDAVGLRSYIVQRYGGGHPCWLGAKAMVWEDNSGGIKITSDNPLLVHVQPQFVKGCLVLLVWDDYWGGAADQPFLEDPCNSVFNPLCEFFPDVGCNDCQHGDCFNGKCLCHDGYTGIHCLEKETVPAGFKKLDDGRVIRLTLSSDPKFNYDGCMAFCDRYGAKPFIPRSPADWQIYKDVRTSLRHYLYLPANDRQQEGTLRWYNGEIATGISTWDWCKGLVMTLNTVGKNCLFYGICNARAQVTLEPCNTWIIYPPICERL